MSRAAEYLILAAVVAASAVILGATVAVYVHAHLAHVVATLPN